MLPVSSHAWKNHTYLTYPAIKGQPEAQAKVAAEPLELFLFKEKDRIGEVLRGEESWAIANVNAYPAAPHSLDFIDSKEPDLRLRFLTPLRIRPDMKLPLFIMVLVHGREHPLGELPSLHGDDTQRRVLGRRHAQAEAGGEVPRRVVVDPSHPAAGVPPDCPPSGPAERQPEALRGPAVLCRDYDCGAQRAAARRRG
jgi:hypothetical protein